MAFTTWLRWLDRRFSAASGRSLAFISYTSRHPADEDLAQTLRTCVEQCGVSTFIAPVDIEAGDIWRETLAGNISRCTHFLVIVSEASIHSEEVQKEITQALKRHDRGGLKIVPVIVGKPSSNPLAHIQAIQLRNYSRFEVVEVKTPHPRSLCRRIRRIVCGDKEAAVPRLGGVLLPKLCDRERQEEQFRSALAIHLTRRRSQPLVFFLCGEEDDDPDGFIERMLETCIRIDTVNSSEEIVARITIAWPDGEPTDAAVDGLKFMLLDALGLITGDVTDEAFVLEVGKLRDAGIVVVHTLRATSWHPEETPSLLRAYLALWEKLAASPRKPFFIIFIKVIYSDVAADLQAGRSPARIRAALSGIVARQRQATALTVRMGEDLGLVHRRDVERWLRSYAAEVSHQTHTRWLNEIFRDGTRLKMEIITEHLERIDDEREDERISYGT